MKQLRITVLLLFIIGSLFYFGYLYRQPEVVKLAEKGMVDLRAVNAFSKPISLNGEWGFHWNKLLRTFPAPGDSTTYSYFPSLWNHMHINGRKLPSQGYASYTLKVLLPRDRPPLALEVPTNFSSYALYLNGVLVAQNGIPAEIRDAAAPFWAGRIVNIPADADTVSLVMHAANYWHDKGGSRHSIQIGSADQLIFNRERNFAMDLTLTGCLFMGGLFFLGLYLFGRHDKTILYFSLFCILYSYRIIGANNYVLHSLFPTLNWWVTIRLEYLSLSVGIALFVRYTMNLFPDESNNRISKGLFWFCVGYSILIIVTPPLFFTALLNFFLVVMFLYIAYALYIYVLAARHKRTGATYALISTGVMLFVFLISLTHFFGWTPPLKAVVFTGYIAFFFLQSLVLSHRFAHTLKRSAFDAEQGLKAKSEFLSTMSHEIRTPLNAVIGMTHLLIGDNPRKDQQENLDVLLFSANNLLVIVNDILDYSKIELGKINLEKISMDLPFIARNLVFGLKEMAVEKRVELKLIVDERLDKKLLGDPTRTGQVINNLLHNAVKFTEQGSVTLSLMVQEASSSFITVLISVEDTGIGISKDKQDLIFERFTQADSSTSRSYGGTGLGLSISKRLLEIQGSKLQLKSEPGVGSCFYFIQRFPVSMEKAGGEAEPVSRQQEEGELLKGFSILLVDDNVFNVMVAQSILERSGSTIHIASNGEEALNKCKEITIDLILMDLHMPVMDGYQATGILRANGATLPIIALTASTKNEVQDEILAAGLTDVIVKPFNPEDLIRVILQHLQPARLPS